MQEDLSNGKAKLRGDEIDAIIKLRKDARKQNGLLRQLSTGIGSSSSVSTGQSGKSNQTSNQTTTGLLKTSGDTMIGPIAFNIKTQTLSGGIINISKSTGTGYSSYVIASAAAGTHDLNTITGAEHNGQILFLDSPTTVTITLKHGVDNIIIPDAADFDIIPDSIAILIYDYTQTAWILVSSFARNGGGAGMTNPATAILDMASFGIENVPYIEGDVNAAHLIVSSVSGDVLYNHNGWSFNVPTAHDHRFYVNDSQVISISGSTISFTPSSSFSVSSATFLSGNVTLGDATGDDITIIGRTASDIIPKTTDVYDLGTTLLRYRNLFLSNDLTITDDILMGGVGSNIVNAGDVSTTTLTVTGLAVLNGDVSLGNSSADNISFTGRISGNPDPINTTIELGQSALRWANIWTQKIDITGSSSTATAIKINSTGGIIDFDGNAISLTATSGFQTLPANPLGFLNAKVGGTNIRIPYYNT